MELVARIPSSTGDRVALLAALVIILFATGTAAVGAKERLDERRASERPCDPGDAAPASVEDSAPAASYRCSDLRGARLIGRDLSFFSFDDSDLTAADFRGALLAETDFPDADLTGAALETAFAPYASFDRAILVGVRAQGGVFTGSSFREADATGADFTAADLTAANLAGVDFSRAILLDARLTGVALDGARWLDTICPDGTNSDASGTCLDHLSPTSQASAAIE